MSPEIISHIVHYACVNRFSHNAVLFRLLNVCKAFHQPALKTLYGNLQYDGFCNPFLDHGSKSTILEYTEDLMVLHHKGCTATAAMGTDLSFPNLKSMTLFLVCGASCTNCAVIQAAFRAPPQDLTIVTEHDSLFVKPGVPDMILGCSARATTITYDMGFNGLKYIPFVFSFPHGPNLNKITFQVHLTGECDGDMFRKVCKSFISALKSVPFGQTLTLVLEYKNHWRDFPAWTTWQSRLERCAKEIALHQQLWVEASLDQDRVMFKKLNSCVSFVNHVPEPSASPFGYQKPVVRHRAVTRGMAARAGGSELEELPKKSVKKKVKAGKLP